MKPPTLTAEQKATVLGEDGGGRQSAATPQTVCFIVEYAGAPIHFFCGGRHSETVTEERASQFTSESNAWYAAYNAGLPPNHVAVVDLSAVGIRHE